MKLINDLEKKYKSVGGSTIAFLMAFAVAFIAGSVFARPAESDAAETRVDADATHYTTISAPDQISVNIGSASSTGTYKVQTETITTKTNSPSGYSLYLSMDSSDNKLYHSADNTKYISATSGTAASPSSLSVNTWGFSTDSSVISSNAAKFAAVPAKNSEVLLQKTTSANTTGTNMSVYYGAMASDALLSGTYSNTVNYTVVADATDTTTVSPTSQNTLAAGTEITVTTPLYTNMADLGTITATVGDVACTDLTTSTATGVLVVKCKTPAKTTIGNYDVVVSVPKFSKSYTVKYGYKKTYTLTYNANGGTGAPANQTCTTDTTTDSCSITISATVPTRAGSNFDYIFAGWATSASAANPGYTAGGSITLASNTTVYAVWYKRFTLSYKGTGTAGTTTSQTCTTTSSTATSCDITIASTAAFTRSGMAFAGWSAYSDPSSESFAEDMRTVNYTSGAKITITQNTTLYSVHRVTITFNPNGGTSTPTTTQSCTLSYAETGCAIAITTAANPSRTNYTFAGWGTTTSATTTTYSPGSTYTFSANTTIYAIWGVNIHTLTVTSQNNKYGTVNTTVTGGMTGAAGTTVTVTATPGIGYVFAGWSDGSTTVSTVNPYTFTMPDKNYSLKATWIFDYTKITDIKVLNVYPDHTSSAETQWPVTSTISFKSAIDNQTYNLYKSASLKRWMEEANAESTNGYGKGIIKVTPVSYTSFNSNPAVADNYDILFFGTWDGNATNGINEAGYQYVKKWIESGKGIIAGHDTLVGIQSLPALTAVGEPFARLRSYFNIKLWSYDSEMDGLGAVYNNTYTAQITKEGLFTTYPWNIGSVGKKLNIPYTHTSGQAAYGDVWIKIVDQTGTPQLADKNGNGVANYFLTTYKNTAMIQTGNANCEATADEEKVIANIIFYMYAYYLANQ